LYSPHAALAIITGEAAGPASGMTRDCRMPRSNESVDVELAHRIDVEEHGLVVTYPARSPEADTAFVGGREKNKHFHEREGRSKPGGKGKIPVFSLVERGGKVRSIVMERVTAPNLRKAVMENAELKAHLMTDSQSVNTHMGDYLTRHDMVDHTQEEYARIGTDGVLVSTNTIESVFSLLKRGVFGTFHHVSRKHLHRYLDEFDFRWNTRIRLGVNDDMRTDIALRRAEGKRLTYRQPIAALRENGPNEIALGSRKGDDQHTP